MSEKMRVHILAKELNVSSKVILEKCRAEGLGDVKNHMSTLSAGLYETICEWFSEEAGGVTAVETSARVDIKKVQLKPKRKRKTKKTAAEEAAAEAAVALDEKAVLTAGIDGKPDEMRPAAVATEVVEPAADAVELDAASKVAAEVQEATAAAPMMVSAPAAPEAKAATEAPSVQEEETVQVAAQAPPAVVQPQDDKTAQEAPEAPAVESQEDQPTVEKEAPVQPAGPQNVPAPAKVRGPRVVRYEAPDPQVYIPRRRSTSTPKPSTPSGPPPLEPSSPARKTVARGGKLAPTTRKRSNPRRSAGRVAEAGEKLREWRDQDLAERKERLAGATGRRIHRRRTTAPDGSIIRGAPGEKTQAKVHEPILMKEFCSETGLNFMQCFKLLRDEHNMMANINMVLPTESAQLLAAHFEIDLEVVPARTRLDVIKDEFKSRDRKNLQPRSPVVAMLGHVDHGKTSLLDAIRKTQVAGKEDGGITQHIGAHRVKGKRGEVTFLDTPGHEAFTAMRSRGAHLTDVVVLVVAADDGLMPQTIEAINHAKSAGVPVVVALNKIDIGEDKVLEIYGQLAEQGLTPSGDWGGEVDVIKTSATMGTGIDELIDHLADLSEILELKADPTVPAMGTVVEAETKTGVGPVARILIQDGTLHVGDAVVCGNGFGKVRAIIDDKGGRLREAGPSLPVEVWGLDDVPSSGDQLFCLPTLQRAKEAASEVKQARLEQGRLGSRKVGSLEELFLQRDMDEVPQLNVIIKADVDGSVEMLRKTLMEIPSDEVRLAIRHAGVGAPNDSDVLLAEACSGIVISFRVEAAAEVRRLAERRGVDIRNYRVVYDVTGDIKKALEGLLAPERHIESRAVAEVRNLFRISKVGLVAGCLITNGTVDRNHLIKVIRDGVVVRDGCKMASLRRFKDDTKEVRSGMECGIRLDGFEDIHEGDKLEAYEVVEIARTL